MVLCASQFMVYFPAKKEQFEQLGLIIKCSVLLAIDKLAKL